MFYGRERELAFLKSKYESNKAEMIVLYGRRRIGKTELLRVFFKEKAHVFYASRECTDREQLTLFSAKLLNGSPMKNYLKSFSNWEDAFRFIKDLSFPDKKVVVIDEFPYMVNGNDSIPSILQNLWDLELRHENIMLVFSGSSMSFIEKQLLGEKNPLYGRTTGIYKLLELDFFTASKFFDKCSNEENILNYAVLGGVPHYLSQFENGVPLETNIKNNILSKGSVLYSEVEFMMRQELRETSIYYTIIEAIALGNTKLNDIYTKTEIDKTKISVYLKNLIDLNIVEREFAVTTSIKKVPNSTTGLYKIKDNFFKFYFRFMFPYLSELELGDVDGLYKFIIEPQMNHYASFIFEDISIQYMRRQNMESKLPFHFSKIGRWWDKKNEIDIVTFDDKGNLLSGECKWKNEKIGLKELYALKEKSTSIEGNFQNKYYYLFSKIGFDEELIKISKIDNRIQLIGLSKIFTKN